MKVKKTEPKEFELTIKLTEEEAQQFIEATEGETGFLAELHDYVEVEVYGCK